MGDSEKTQHCDQRTIVLSPNLKSKSSANNKQECHTVPSSQGLRRCQDVQIYEQNMHHTHTECAQPFLVIITIPISGVIHFTLVTSDVSQKYFQWKGI